MKSKGLPRVCLKPLRALSNSRAAIYRQLNGLARPRKVLFDARATPDLNIEAQSQAVSVTASATIPQVLRRLFRQLQHADFSQAWTLMPDSQTTPAALFVEAFRTLAPKRAVPEVDVRYYPYAGLNHTIRLRSGRVHVRLSDVFKSAPVNVHRALAFILVSKLLRRRSAPPFYERVYRDYAFSPEVLRASDLARKKRGRKMVSSSQGCRLQPRAHVPEVEPALLRRRASNSRRSLGRSGARAQYSATTTAYTTPSSSARRSTPRTCPSGSSSTSSTTRCST